MRNSKRIGTVVTAGFGALSMVALAACGGSGDGGSQGVDRVVFAVPSWVGAEANVAVASYLLEQELDVRASSVAMDVPDAWDALHAGEVDAILEDWRGEPAREKEYVDRQETVVEGGDLGVTGHIGWFVPKYYADEHPEISDWRNLDDLAEDFRTPKSGDRGQLLEGSPSYTTNDEAIIRNLDLNLEPVYAGSESEQITQIRKNNRQKKPFLTYFWTPQWLTDEVELVEVELPAYKEGCASDPKEVDCAYPNTPLQKYFNAEFAEKGGAAADFLKNFKWDEEHQNEVARMIKIDERSPREAARRWVADHEDVWREWIPED